MPNQTSKICNSRFSVMVYRDVANSDLDRDILKISRWRLLDLSFYCQSPVVEILHAFVKDILKIVCMQEDELETLSGKSNSSNSINFLPLSRHIQDEIRNILKLRVEDATDQTACIPFSSEILWEIWKIVGGFIVIFKRKGH